MNLTAHAIKDVLAAGATHDRDILLRQLCMGHMQKQPSVVANSPSEPVYVHPLSLAPPVGPV